MKQLTIRDIIDMANILVNERDMSPEDVMDLPVYIGDDDELNGIHSGFECRIIDSDDEEDEYFIEMIRERRGNHQLENGNTALLIC